MENFDFYTEVVTFFTNHQIASIVFVVLVLYLVWIQITIWKNGIKSVDAGMASMLCNHSGYGLLDVRLKADYAAGHLSGAYEVSVDDFKAGNFGVASKFADKGVVIIGKDLDDPVAYNAACLLKKAGYKNPVILKGGMVDWVGRGLPVVKK